MTTPRPAAPRSIHILHPGPLLLLLLALLLYSYRTYNLAVPTFYGIADEHGYMMTAKRLATHASFAQHQPDPYAFIGETMMQSTTDPTTYYLRQPVGYPLLLAAAYAIGGPDAPFFVNPLLGLALLIAIYIIGRELGAPLMAAIAALVLALHPLVLYYTVTPLSHIPDMAAAAWAIAGALLWRKHPNPWLAAATGALLGLAIMIRYTNLLLALPLAIILLDKAKHVGTRTLARHTALAATATFLFIIPLLIYHSIAFGSPFRTGYSAGGNATSFSLAWFLQHAPAMARILLHPDTGLGLLLLGLAAGLIILALRNRFALALLLAWGGPALLLYTAYYGMPASNTLLYARFALAPLPPLLLLALLWPAFLPKHRPLFQGLTAADAALSIALALYSPFMNAETTKLTNNMLAQYAVGNVVRAEVPPHSVLVADLFTEYFLDYTGGGGDYILYNHAMYEKNLLDARLSDLHHAPHENDPARTKQLCRHSSAGKSDLDLMSTLRERLAHYDDMGTPVYLATHKARAPIWAQALKADLRPLAATPGDGEFIIYRVEFPPEPTTTSRP